MRMEIKDYLHLYLMCKYQWKDEDGEWRRPEHLTAYQLNSIRQRGCEVRLLLRKLSDMTEEEFIEIYKLDLDGQNKNYDGDSPSKRYMINFAMQNMKDYKVFRWLLSKSFDLFGLIEAGLAIDITTLNH